MGGRLIWDDLVEQARSIEESDLDEIRNICRCGTYTRICEAIKQGESQM